MKQIAQLVFVSVFVISSLTLDAQISGGSYTIPGTVGATTVNNLTELAAMLNSNAVNGNCVFEFTSAYTGTETFPVVFNQHSGAGKVVIRPAGSVSTPLVTSGTTTQAALIDLNHAHDITLDGRAGGQGSTINWQFKNMQGNSAFPVFRFINNANNDTLQYLDIVNSDSIAASVLISTSNTGTGNRNDVIQHCRIGNTAALAFTAIHANGSAAPNNNGFITIRNNEIFNFQGTTNSAPTNGGIVVTGTGNNAGNWSITGNSFYSTRTTVGSFVTAIYFAPGNSGSPTGNVISGNYIGGRAPMGGTHGTPWIFNGRRGFTTYTDFTGIFADGANTISNNVIQNIRLSSPNSTQTFSGINIDGSTPTTVSGNTVGSATDTTSIHAGGMGVVVGIWNQNSAAVTIDNNTVANLTSNTAYQPSTWTYADVIGIYNYNSGLLGNTTTTNNRVFNLTTANANNLNQYFPINGGGGISTQPFTYSRSVMAGIYMQSTGSANHVISGNSVYGLRSTYGAGGNTSYIHGIVANGGTGNVTVDANEVYGLWAPDNYGANLYFIGLTGIYLPTAFTGKYTVTNNMVSLGLKPTDGSSVQNALISGIWDNTDNNSGNLRLRIYHNSVYIGGTNNNTYSNNLNSYAFRRMLSYGSTVYDSTLVVNNIFVNNRSTTIGTGKNYGMYLNSPINVISDYNNVYGTGAGFIFTNIGGTDYASLAAAQAVTNGLDDNSIAADPLYTSTSGTAPDLHIPLNSPANQAGTTALTATTDFDGTIRANYTPVDLGATVAGGGAPCSPTTAAIIATACGSYTSPSGYHVWTTGGTYTDTLTNVAGCDSIVTINLTINSIHTASITPVSVIICNGGSATLTASGGGTYAWSNGLGSNAQVSVSPTTQTTYTVTVTGANTCTATASKTVSVNQLPNAGIAGANAVCTGSSVQLTATGGTSYSWSNSLGSNAQVSVAPTSQTTYTVTVTDGNSCTATASKTVTVNQLPAVTANASATTACAGTAVTLNGSNAATYVWNNGVSNGIAFTAVNTTTYTVTGTDANSCSATASVTVNVNTLPNAAISGPTTICAGLQATLTASGGTGYSWSNSLGTNAQVTVTPVSAATYTVTVTDGNNCSATAAHTVTVTNAPVASITGVTQSCSGESITLTADGGNTYTWADGLGANASITVSPTGTTTYTVTATVGANCSATASHTVTVFQAAASQFSQSICSGESYTYNGVALTTGGAYSDTLETIDGCDSIVTLNLTVNQLPAATITAATNTNFCTGDDVILSAPAGTVTYLWSNGETTQSVTVNTSGAYSVTVTGAGTCTAESAPEIVTAFPLPAVPVITRENDTLISTPSAGYQWYFNNTILDGSTDPKLTITQNGPYYVEVSDTNGCTNRSATYNAISVSVKDMTAIGGVKLYPNPSTGNFVIEFGDDAEREIVITDVTGRVVYSGLLTATLNPINTAFTPNIYLLHIKQHNHQYTLKVTITR